MDYEGDDGHSGNEDSPSKEDASSIEPPRKKGRKHREKVSWVWQYFIEEGNVAICQFCEASLSIASTTTLKYHLNHLHKNLIVEGEPNLNEPKPRIQVVSIPSKSPLKNSVNVTKNPSKHFLKETTALISKMLGKPSSNIRVVQVIQDDQASNIENCQKKDSSSSKGYAGAGNMATCQFCQASLSSASTTTLKYHLNHLHKDLLTENETTATTTTDSAANTSQTEIVEIDTETIPIPEITSMPHLKITTNISNSLVPSDFLNETSALLSKMLDKPESCSIVTVVPERQMLWGGVQGPCAIARLRGVGNLGESDNINLKMQLGEHIEKFLGVPPSRMLIHNDTSTAYF
uniref:L-dopachrome isomerase n=1 Tax=Daphnia galeata TaxID=27404 RepID=A0A8J2R9U2_9CRUS|nr:unnamed protein product [Daphnia galeata]